MNEPAIHELTEVVEVGRVAAVPDDDTREIDAFLDEHLLLKPAGLVRRIRMCRDRHTCLPMGPRCGAQDPVHIRRDPGLFGDDFQERRLDCRAADAFLNVLEEHLGHQLRYIEQPAGTAIVEEVRHLGKCVETCRHNDVDLNLFGDALDPRDITSQSDDGRIDDAVDAHLLQGGQLGNRIIDASVFVPLGLCGEVVGDLGADDKHVLVHEGSPETVGGDRPPRGFNFWHGKLLSQVVGMEPSGAPSDA